MKSEDEIQLKRKALIASHIPAESPVAKEFVRMISDIASVLQDPDYEHPFVTLGKHYRVVRAVAGEDTLLDSWRAKLRNLAAIVLTDEEPEEEHSIVDRYGCFFNTVNVQQALSRLGCVEEDIRQTVESTEQQRSVHRQHTGLFSVIVLNHAQFRILTEHLYEHLYITLWHELGHLFFNPALHHYVSGDHNVRLQTPKPELEKAAGSFKRSKPMQYLIEGTAEWFAYHAQDWNEMEPSFAKAADHLFASQFEESNEYSFFRCLQQYPAMHLHNVLLPLFFNCLQVSLFNLIITEDGDTFGLTPEDYGGLAYQGRNLFDWASFPNYILHGLEGRTLGWSELLHVGAATRDLVDADFVEKDALKAAGIDISCGVNSPQPSDPGLVREVPLWGKQACGSRFDDYYLTAEQEVPRSLGIGIRRVAPFVESVLGITNRVNDSEKCWWIHMLLTGSSVETTLFNENAAWGTESARRSAFYTWLRD
jgi:hypothetical protein